MSTDIRKVPEHLSRGDRIIFAKDMGGSGEVVTVISVSFDDDSVAYIRVEEKPFPILSMMQDTIGVAS